MPRSPFGGNAHQGSNWIRRPKRLAIYERDGWRCQWCDRPVVDGRTLRAAKDPTLRLATLDHFVSRRCGGKNSAANLVTSCAECNEARGETPAMLYVGEDFDRLDRLLEQLSKPVKGSRL